MENEGFDENTRLQRSQCLAKFHELERTWRALSHSRWDTLSSANRGITATIGGSIEQLNTPSAHTHHCSLIKLSQV